MHISTTKAIKAAVMHTVFAAGLVAVSGTTTHGWKVTSTVLHLSSARRDLGGAVTASGTVVFGGGCVGGESVFTCEEASASIDLFKDGAPYAYSSSSSSPALTYARGWPSTCALGESVAFLGGGTSGSRSHKPVLDVLDLTTMQVKGNDTALDAGRWGTACVTYNDAIYFGGGKEVTWLGQYKMTDEVLVLPSADGGKSVPVNGLAHAPFKFSVARESTGAVALGSSAGGVGIMFAGGWISWKEPGTPSAVVDSYALSSSIRESLPPSSSPSAAGTVAQPYTWSLETPAANQYWVGAAQWNETVSYIADSTTLYEVTKDVFTGAARPVEHPLPQEVARASGIPAARLSQNGVNVANKMVCFYTATPNGLVCFTPATGQFELHPCTAAHTAGAIAGAGASVYVAGGVDANSKLTDVVDVISFTV